MTGEFSFFGMYFPVLMLTSLIALVATRLISLFLARKGFYRHIWHPRHSSMSPSFSSYSAF